MKRGEEVTGCETSKFCEMERVPNALAILDQVKLEASLSQDQASLQPWLAVAVSRCSWFWALKWWPGRGKPAAIGTWPVMRTGTE